MESKYETIGIIFNTNNLDANKVKSLSDTPNKYNLKFFEYCSFTGKIFDNLLKFKYFLSNKEYFSVCTYLIYIGRDIGEDELQLLMPSDKDVIKTINYSGDVFGCNTKMFFELSLEINNYIQNDLVYDVNVTNWNYQINKYLKTRTNVINYNLKHITYNNPNSYFNMNLFFVTVNLTGGLGNLLFQIFATYNYAKLNNLIPIFSVHKSNNPRPSICKYRLFDKLQKYSSHDNINFDLVNESLFFDNMKEIKNVKLIGLFHDFKYIKETTNKIYEILNFNDLYNIDIQQYKSEQVKNLISVHVRRTDYLKCNIYYKLDKEYYQKAISHFDNDTSIFIVFSDDIEWCKNSDYFVDISNVIFVNSTLSDEESLYLMSKCDHNIIANSTFSLWGYYLNQNPNKILVMPKKWFTTDTQFNPEYLTDGINIATRFI